MAIQQLDNLVKIGKLKIEAPERAEFDGLVRSGSVRLKDAQNEKLAAAYIRPTIISSGISAST